jgi:hypothetical protein
MEQSACAITSQRAISIAWRACAPYGSRAPARRRSTAWDDSPQERQQSVWRRIGRSKTASTAVPYSEEAINAHRASFRCRATQGHTADQTFRRGAIGRRSPPADRRARLPTCRAASSPATSSTTRSPPKPRRTIGDRGLERDRLPGGACRPRRVPRAAGHRRAPAFARAYSSLPTRRSVDSRSRTAVASTFSRGMPVHFSSAATQRRMRGSARPNSPMRTNLSASRTARQPG